MGYDEIHLLKEVETTHSKDNNTPTHSYFQITLGLNFPEEHTTYHAAVPDVPKPLAEPRSRSTQEGGQHSVHVKNQLEPSIYLAVYPA